MRTKMITLAIALFGFAFALQAQTEETVSLFFVSVEDDGYFFEEPDGTIWNFSVVPQGLIDKYDLKGKTSKGKSFEVEYATKIEVDEDDFEYEVYIIRAMKPIRLAREIEEEEEWDD